MVVKSKRGTFTTALFLAIAGVATLVFGFSFYSGNDLYVFLIIPIVFFFTAVYTFIHGLVH